MASATKTVKARSFSTPSSAQILRLDDYRVAREPEEEPSLPQFLYFSVTVNEALESALRLVVADSCGAEASCIRIESIPRRQQSRLWLCLLPVALEKAVHAIIVSLPSAEFGSITAKWP